MHQDNGAEQAHACRNRRPRVRGVTGARWISSVAICATFVLFAGAAAAAALEAEWSNGLRFSAADGSASLKMGGRILNDWAFFHEDDDYRASAGSVADGTEFRSARIYASGVIGGVVEFKGQYDLSSASNDFKDVYVGLKRLGPLGVGIRAGHFKQPFGLEELTSGKYTTFMERSTTASFAPSRKTGVMLHDTFADNSGTWAASVYRNTDKWGGAQEDGVYNYAGRVTFVPWEGEEDGDLIHVGAAFTTRTSADDTAEFATEPPAHLLDDFSEVTLAAERANIFGGEVAAVFGQFSVQGEYVSIMTTAPDGAEDASYSSFYAQASVFLTGEKRPYKKSSGTFDRVKPTDPMTAKSGKGAVEVAVRYGHTDLEDDTADGGTLDSISAGLNWYVNPNARVMLNYVRADGDTPDAMGVVNVFQTRFQVDF